MGEERQEAVVEDDEEDEEDEEDDEDDMMLYDEEKGFRIYEGPLSGAIKALKMFSITSCAMSMVASPLLVLMSDPSISFTARAGLGFTVLTFGVSTTGAMSFLTSPYVVGVWQHDEDLNNITIESYSLLGTRKCTPVSMDQVDTNVTRPFISFTDAASGNSFFIHRQQAEDHPTLEKLVGAAPAEGSM